ncbi:MAG: bifunctional 5,10-methylenetetrahydrofolate dehydrogenase/5,10-methenyltetrahydrofolate cyclohydrolase [Bacilli bacterium]|nr:bifunctional 5,10-methylenetetrahydrofolate dehydrogenase/5,10-methenyltetrahydrofolate cyclohydrolase [Bacilli bacterium]
MKLLDGRIVKKDILDGLKVELSMVKKKLCFVVIQIGSVSDIYINSKRKLALDLDYDLILVKLDSDVNDIDVISVIDKYNNDDNVDGIMIELPIPSRLNYDVIRNSINPNKDIDGVTDINIGKVVTNNGGICSCTAKAVIDILKYYDIDVSGKNVVIIGRSNLVGKPLYNMLVNEDATVTVCHSKTKNLSFYTKNADIIVVCVGISNFLTGDMVKDDSIVVDVGTNVIEGKLCGDVDFSSVKDKVSYITPVPYGVGQVTTSVLGENIYKCYVNREI